MDKELLKIKYKRLLFSGLKYEIDQATEKCENIIDFNHEIEKIRDDYNESVLFLDEHLK